MPAIRDYFEALLPGAAAAPRSVVIGKVGSRSPAAAFAHRSITSASWRPAELNVLRHIDVLSCVSGGSIVGACYWLALRRRMKQPAPLAHKDYIDLVEGLIKHFTIGVEGNLRPAVQPGIFSAARDFLLRSAKGALDPEKTARAIDELFIRPLMEGSAKRYMHELPFTPSDHDAALTQSEDFHPERHNWLRQHKVPVLVLNATTVNTGHGWQFTPTRMGELPWTIHKSADSVPRLEWAWYAPEADWQMKIARAVTASALCPACSSRSKSKMRTKTSTSSWWMEAFTTIRFIVPARAGLQRDPGERRLRSAPRRTQGDTGREGTARLRQPLDGDVDGAGTPGDLQRFEVTPSEPPPARSDVSAHEGRTRRRHRPPQVLAAIVIN